MDCTALPEATDLGEQTESASCMRQSAVNRMIGDAEAKKHNVLYQDTAVRNYQGFIRNKRFKKGVSLSTSCSIFKTAWEVPEQNGLALPSRVVRHFKHVLPKRTKSSKSSKKHRNRGHPKSKGMRMPAHKLLAAANNTSRSRCKLVAAKPAARRSRTLMQLVIPKHVLQLSPCEMDTASVLHSNALKAHQNPTKHNAHSQSFDDVHFDFAHSDFADDSEDVPVLLDMRTAIVHEAHTSVFASHTDLFLSHTAPTTATDENVSNIDEELTSLNMAEQTSLPHSHPVLARRSAYIAQGMISQSSTIETPDVLIEQACIFTYADAPMNKY